MTTPLKERLKRLPILSTSSDNLVDDLLRHGKTQRYKPLELVYLQGNLPHSAYLILAGIVNRETTQDGGVLIQHSRAFAGDWLGLANATSRNAPYLHSALVVDNAELLAFDLPKLSLLRTNQEFSHYLLQVAGKERLIDEQRRLNSLSSARHSDKLIMFLADEMARMQKEGVSTMYAPYVVGTQQYFADSIGASRETVARIMQPLISAGIIERTQGVQPARYTILKQEELLKLASSPLRRAELYRDARAPRMHRRFSDVA